MADQTILLCGGTGMLGGEVARRLAARGIPFRALVRPRTDATTLEALGAVIVRGDLRNRPSLDPAVAGVGTVISTATAMVRMITGDKELTLRDVDDAGYANLIAASEQAGVQRFVYASMVTPPAGNALDAAKAATERRLQASRLREVIVRADMIQESHLTPMAGFDWPHGKVTIFGRGRTPNAYISNGDFAEAMIRLALADDPPRLVEVGGPERITRNQAAARFAEASGRTMRVRHIPRPVLWAGAHLLGPVQPLGALMMSSMLEFDTIEWRIDDKGLRALGIEPKPVSQYIREVVATATSSSPAG